MNIPDGAVITTVVAMLCVTYLFSRTAVTNRRATFRVKCPCCLKELVIDPKRETANLPSFKDQED